MVCLKCNEIYDRIIYSPIGEGEKLNGKCYECGSKKYIEWDYKAKKCPQCKDGIIGESDGRAAYPVQNINFNKVVIKTIEEAPRIENTTPIQMQQSDIKGLN